MNRLERMTAILLFLQERPRTAAEIAAHFEVSRRTIFRDVQALSEMGVPVIAREGAGGGYELPEDYSLAPLALTARECFLLLLALNALNQPADIPFSRERATLQAKLRTLLPAAQLGEVEKQLEKVTLDFPTRVQRAPFLEELIAAVNENLWLEVTYRSAERTSLQHLLPRNLNYQDGFWYCRAFSLEREEERTYRVDRIEQMKYAVELIQQIEVKAAQAEPYARENDPWMRVVLSRQGTARMERDPHLGRSLQPQEDGSGILEIHFPARELDWYAAYFAGFGDEAVVEQPPELRSRLVKLGQNLVERYSRR
jgi:predicted DNA-binding transcriptional regulator YafY